ncbi:peptidoglycan DD-metalloendopeptidase family protein [Streptomyces sp. NPDC012623]|uniref:M23 family metallopeptidase n=1 Tax=unclassified Streptomyces TaxID=2593676 RepID=UPI0036AC0D4A
MNDQHAHAGYAAHDGYQNGSFATDPLFGNLPDGSTGSAAHTGHPGHSGYDTSGYEDPAALSSPYETGQYDSTQWNTGAHATVGYDAYGTPQYDTSGQWVTVPAESPDQWDAPWNPAPEASQPNGSGTTGQFENAQFDGGQFENGQFENTPYETGQFDSRELQNPSFGYDTTDQGQPQGQGQDLGTSASFGTAPFESEQFRTAPFAYEATAQWAAPAFGADAYEAAWNAPGTTSESHQDTVLVEAVVPEQYGADSPYETDPASPYGSGADFSAPGPEPERAYDTEADAEPASVTDSAPGPGSPAEDTHEAEAVHMAATMTVPAVSVTPRPTGRAGGSGSGGRGRRRPPAKRSALLTIAVPSACVMGVAGVAAASVGGLGGGEEDKATTAAAADTTPEKPAAAAAANKKLDTQLATLSAGARDFGDRASRTQERIDLQARKEADRKKRAEEAARKEAERPKFVLPVSQHGLSAYYGQAGVNWMSVHTGIDFPVSYGTPVMAATDGTVRTQYNSAYGNMAIVTSPDGTETWYCHLSSTKIRSGSVKAGDVIAYSGSSGNSTGPHLHFEVRPGAGAAIDPLPWLRSHGVDPT